MAAWAGKRPVLYCPGRHFWIARSHTSHRNTVPPPASLPHLFPSLPPGNSLSWAPVTSIKIVNAVACVMLDAYNVVEKAFKAYFEEKQSTEEIANAASSAIKQ